MKPKGWKGESRRHSLARKGVSTVIDGDRRFDVSNFVARGRVVHGYDIDKIYNGFVEAMLWSTTEMGLKDDEEIYLDENYGIYDVDKDTEQAIKFLIEDFMEENYELFDEIQINDNIHISEEQIGHDLLLTTQGHGVGFWDRGYGLNGELLTKESKKFFNDSMYAFSHDGKIYFEGLELKASGSTTAESMRKINKRFDESASETAKFLDRSASSTARHIKKARKKFDDSATETGKNLKKALKVRK